MLRTRSIENLQHSNIRQMHSAFDLIFCFPSLTGVGLFFADKLRFGFVRRYLFEAKEDMFEEEKGEL